MFLSRHYCKLSTDSHIKFEMFLIASAVPGTVAHWVSAPTFRFGPALPLPNKNWFFSRPHLHIHPSHHKEKIPAKALEGETAFPLI